MARKRRKTGKQLWALLRVLIGSVLLIPAALVMWVAYVVLPTDVWNWYKSWIGSGEAPAKLPKPEPVAEQFPAPHYVPIHTETEINEPQRNHREVGTEYLGDNPRTRPH